MKMFPRFLVVLLALAVPFGAYAKKKGKGEPAETPIPLPGASNPAEALSPYIVNLEQLLALGRAPKTEKQPLYTQTSGLLVTLRQQLVVEQTKASAEAKNMYTAAINTADLITAALQDREKALADLRSSTAVQGTGKLEEQGRKDNIAQGIKGDHIGKAAAVIMERDREREANAKAAARSGHDQNAMTAMAANQWDQRAIAWRQKIAGSYSQIK
jgi:hypothetical protein